MIDQADLLFTEQVEAEVRRRLGSILQSHEKLRGEREEHVKQIQDLRIKLNKANLESLTDRKSRLAALNLMEDAATARSAERREYEDRIRTEEALLLAERQYRILFESIDEGFCLLEAIFDSQGKAQDYRFLQVNPAFEKHTGIANARGKTVLELGYDQDQIWFDDFARIALTGVPQRFERYSISLQRWFDVNAFRINVAGEQKVAVLFNDISQRKIAEETMRESEQRFRSLVESYAQAVWESNAQGEIEKDSPTWRSFTGQTLDEWLGEGWINAIHPDDREYAARQWRKAVRHQSTFDAEFRLKQASGDWRWTNVRATPIRAADGKITKWSGMNIDIDDRKKAEEALKHLNAELDQLVKVRTAKLQENETQLRHHAEQLQEMATQLSRTEQVERRKLSQLLHDHVQQLLVTLKMRLGMLKKSLPGGPEHEQLQKIDELLSECINATRTLAVRLLPPLLHDQGLPAALEWLISRVKEDQGLIVTASIDAEANPLSIEAREVLFQAAQEFLLNIVKHAGVHEANLDLRKNNQNIHLSVADQGHGFDTAKAGITAGTYGLYQLKQRLLAINGNLEIESNPNGSKLIATLK